MVSYLLLTNVTSPRAGKIMENVIKVFETRIYYKMVS